MKKLVCLLTLVIVGVFSHSPILAQAAEVYAAPSLGGVDISIYLPLIQKGIETQENAVVIKSSNDFVPATNYLYIVGEIANQTSNIVRFIRIKATLYDSANQVIYTTPDPGVVPMITIIKPQNKSPFRVSITPIPVGYARYELTLTYSDTTTDMYLLEAINVETYWDNILNAYHVKGTAHNQTVDVRSGVKAVVTLYDANGKVIGVDYETTTPSSLNANADGTFDVEMMFWDGKPDQSLIKSYQLQIADD